MTRRQVRPVQAGPVKPSKPAVYTHALVSMRVSVPITMPGRHASEEFQPISVEPMLRALASILEQNALRPEHLEVETVIAPTKKFPARERFAAARNEEREKREERPRIWTPGDEGVTQ